MGEDPQDFNGEVRRRALAWVTQQEGEYRRLTASTFRARVDEEERLQLQDLGNQENTKNPILRKLRVSLSLCCTIFSSVLRG